VTPEQRITRLEDLLMQLCDAIAAHSDTEWLPGFPVWSSERTPPLEHTAARIKAEIEDARRSAT
jgi:hypothetical protein